MKPIFNIKRISFHILFMAYVGMAAYFIGCRDKEQNETESNEENKEQVVFEIHTSADTVTVNKYLRCYAYLKKSHFKNSGIIVYIANDDEYSLKQNLSNEYDVAMDIFPNLSHDTINQKWIGQYDFDKTAVFGRKFKSVGKDTIRGYILEYQNKELPMDSVFKSEEVKKYYFEKEIYVDSSQN
ncbi:hypothetical protein HME9304_02137 [Flagellimonas maritima]|uniref:Uncharacterized protein n=1 Tax=Flagellimonas maritima TaxID=1383885 RepID=A0A2Z4LV02_9FLAO|nr:hypothetical protein [Allomuricauda aurantiaca]AWX45127.1 hypothetical protein HME9304_02137 [Allomuricauda aurantiaca]